MVSLLGWPGVVFCLGCLPVGRIAAFVLSLLSSLAFYWYLILTGLLLLHTAWFSSLQSVLLLPALALCTPLAYRPSESMH